MSGCCSLDPMMIPLIIMLFPVLMPIIFGALHLLAPILLIGALTRLFFNDCIGDCSDKKAPVAADKVTVRDPSAVRCELVGDEKVKVVVACPGLKAKDIDVKLVDDFLRVTGESKKDLDVYCIARDIQLPRGCDCSTMAATHEDGLLTIVVHRRRVSIPVVSATPVSVTTATGEPGKEAAKGAEDEWEPLQQNETSLAD